MNIKGKSFQSSLDHPIFKLAAHIIIRLIIWQYKQIRIIEIFISEYPIKYGTYFPFIIFRQSGCCFIKAVKHCFYDNHVICLVRSIIKMNGIKSGMPLPYILQCIRRFLTDEMGSSHRRRIPYFFGFSGFFAITKILRQHWSIPFFGSGSPNPAMCQVTFLSSESVFPI